jgi:hypothetical protein
VSIHSTIFTDQLVSRASLAPATPLCGLAAPRLPQRVARTAGAEPQRLRAGKVGLITLGRTRVSVPFPHLRAHFGGVVAEFCRPWFKVFFDDGDVADYEGHELAKHVTFEEADFYDPRSWYYDFSVMNPASTPGWSTALNSYCDSFGLELPAAWLESTDKASTTACEEQEDDDVFLAAESTSLRTVHREMLGAAREKRTIRNLRNPGLKLLWWCASRRYNFPPTANDAAMYYTKLATNQNSIGAVSVARNALSFICAFNDIPRHSTTACA